MATNQAGDETKIKIFETAKKLFYEKGFKKASCSEIASVAKVNQALIYYHFTTKTNLGLEVCNDFTRDLRNEIAIRTYKGKKPFDAVVSTVVEYKVFNKIERFNGNYRRFIKELCDVNAMLLTDHYLGMSLYKTVRNKYHKELSPVDEKIAHYSITSIISGIIITMNEGYIDCSREYLIEKEIQMMLRILDFNDHEIKKITSNAQLIFDSIDINMGKNFKVY